MALKPQTVAPKIAGAFAAALAESPDLGDDFLPNSSYHLPAYIISLKDLVDVAMGQDIESVAREVAWQCLAFSKNAGTVVVGEVTPVNKAPRPPGRVFEGSLRMTSLSYGGPINEVFNFAKRLDARQVELARTYNITGDHQPRMLRIPGLLITAVWLRAASPGSEDWIVPLHTKIPGLKAKEIYSMDEFLTITQPLAKNCLSRPALE